MARNSYNFRPLTAQEVLAHDGFNYVAILTANDLTVTATATAQLFVLGPIPKGCYVLTEHDLRVAFKDASDAAFNDCTFSLGDDSSVTAFAAAKQLNENGTEILAFRGAVVGPEATTTNHVNLTVNSMTGKALVNIDIGELRVYMKLIDVVNQTASDPAVGMTK